MKLILQRPVAGFQLDSRVAETVPAGAAIEVSHSSPNGWIDFFWDGSKYSAFREEFLDACTVEEVSRLALRRSV